MFNYFRRVELVTRQRHAKPDPLDLQ